MKFRLPLAKLRGFYNKKMRRLFMELVYSDLYGSDVSCFSLKDMTLREPLSMSACASENVDFFVR